MKFKIEAGKLEDILEELVLIAPSKLENRPHLSHLKFDVREDKLIIFATDTELSMAKEIPVQTLRPGMCTAPAKHLMSLVKNFKKEQILTLAMIDDKKIRITQSRSRFNLSSGNPLAFPEMIVPDVEYCPMNPTAFVEAIDKVSSSMAGEKDGRPSLQAILFEPAEEDGFIRAVASEGHKLMTCKVPGILDGPILISKNSIAILKRAISKSDEMGIFVDVESASLIVKLDAGYISTRLMKNNFPDYRRFLPRGSFMIANINRPDFIQVLKRVMLFADASTSTVHVNISAADQTITVKSENSDGEAEEVATLLPGSTIDNDIEIKFNGKYLEQVLSNYEKGEIGLRLYGGTAPAVLLDGSNMMGIVMPVSR